MHVEIVMIGTELLLGQIVDTNAAFMGTILAENGINLYQKSTVGDNRERICNVLEGALSRSDVVLVSGGLGPTEDDITRECVAEVSGRALEFREDLCEDLSNWFTKFGHKMSENNKKQAYAPEGAFAIANPNGTAPGLIVESDKGVIICMPGVPRELESMLCDSVVPYLREKFDIGGVLHSRVLKVCGMGESQVDAMIGGLIKSQQNPTVGVLASPASVKIRITARAESIEEADALIDEVDAKVRSRLPGRIMGVNDDTLESVVAGLLEKLDWTICIAETTTGGVICKLLTSTGSKTFLGGEVTTERPDAEEDAKGVAERAAAHVQKRFDADCALAVIADEENNVTAGVLLTPKGRCNWSTAYVSRDPVRQLRMGVVALEHVRRFLKRI